MVNYMAINVKILSVKSVFANFIRVISAIRVQLTTNYMIINVHEKTSVSSVQSVVNSIIR